MVGDAEHDPSSDVVAQVANEVYGQDLLSLLVTHLGQLDFEVSQLAYADRLELIIRHVKTHLRYIVLYYVVRLDPDYLLWSSLLDDLISSLTRSRGELAREDEYVRIS